MIEIVRFDELVVRQNVVDETTFDENEMRLKIHITTPHFGRFNESKSTFYLQIQIAI
jgi:hypothetical protein